MYLQLLVTTLTILPYGCTAKNNDNYINTKSKYVNIPDQVIAISYSQNLPNTLAKAKNSQEDANGPTLRLSYGDDEVKKNPLADFMYFVPLISPVDVTSKTSKDNQQIGYIISCERKTKNNSFYVSCDFRMQGKGFHINDFDNEQMIDRNKKGLHKGEHIKNIMDYIRFEGQGYGRIKIKGKINNSKETVTQVDVHFNARGHKSPVFVGLYSVKPVNGKYKYKNKYNSKVARVNTLRFRKTSDTPKMGIEIDAVGDSKEALGFWAGIVGKIANYFIEPIEISKIGNNTMLRLGLYLYRKESEFTFPKAENLIK